MKPLRLDSLPNAVVVRHRTAQLDVILQTPFGKVFIDDLQSARRE